MSAHHRPAEIPKSKNGQEMLAQALICVFGSASELSIVRNLHKSGARNIRLVNINTDSPPTISSSNIDSALNEYCQLRAINWSVNEIEEAIQAADIVIDNLPDWQQKLALSDICMDQNKALVHSGISGFRFQIYTMIPGKSACLRCALPLAGIDQVPLQPTVSTPLQAVIELVDAWQSLETVKYVAKIGIVQGNELFKFDCLSGEFEVIRGLDPQPGCPDCGRIITRLKKPQS